MASLILTERGTPQVPAAVARGLRELDENLSAVWHPYMQQWSVMMRWPQGDRRWQAVQQQQIKEEDAHDMVTTLPADCTVHELMGYLEARLVRSTDEVHQALHRAVVRHNANRKVEQVEEQIGEVVDSTFRDLKAMEKGYRGQL